jgi:hypothetical protein
MPFLYQNTAKMKVQIFHYVPHLIFSRPPSSRSDLPRPVDLHEWDDLQNRGCCFLPA